MKLRSAVTNLLPALVFLALPATGGQTAPTDSRSLAAPTPVADSLVDPATTRHEIALGKEKIAYRAIWAERVLKDAAGDPQATISSTSYIREGVRKPGRRPVMFLFNGGPGASSSPLHFEAFGPRRRSQGKLVNNESTLLDAADLVFIDPVGTGFSRELKAGGGRAFWSLDGDAKAARDLIRARLREQGREHAPVFIAGESYGGMRLALMSEDMSGVDVRGLVFLSPVTDMTATASVSGNDLPYIFDLPSMAVAAWANGKAGAKDADVAEVWERARGFAQGDYAVALQQGAALPPSERRRIAERISTYIGLPPSMIEAADIRVGTQTFLESLLDGKIVGRTDTRVTAPRRDKPQRPGRPKAADDPALGLGRTNVIKSELAATYFRDELKVETTRDYYSLTLDVNFNWNWQREGPAFYLNATPNVAKLMVEKPELKVMLVSGYYDLATPMLGQRYAFTHGGLPLERVDMFAQAAPHSPFDNDETRARLAARIRDFIRTGAR